MFSRLQEELKLGRMRGGRHGLHTNDRARRKRMYVCRVYVGPKAQAFRQKNAFSCRELELLSLEYSAKHHQLSERHDRGGRYGRDQGRVSDALCKVDIEKVKVQPRLHQPRHNRNRIHSPLRKVPINPIRDIKRPVRSKSRNVMCRYRLRLARALQHEQLREYSDAFEEDGECPEDLDEVEFVVEEEGEEEGWAEEELDPEGVDGRVVRWPDWTARVLRTGGRVEGPMEARRAEEEGDSHDERTECEYVYNGTYLSCFFWTWRESWLPPPVLT